jgi:phosphopantothenoylcysteine decarboxylase/phosphopantothenate--cysteine ligase
VALVPVVTAREMRREVLARWRRCDAVVMAAAVSDYRPRAPSSAKLKRTAESMTLELRANPDILAEMGARRGAKRTPLLVGFCVETHDLAAAARAKLAAKRCDLLVANLAGDALGLETTRVEIHRPRGRPLGPFAGPKDAVADSILDVVARALRT